MLDQLAEAAFLANRRLKSHCCYTVQATKANSDGYIVGILQMATFIENDMIFGFTGNSGVHQGLGYRWSSALSSKWPITTFGRLRFQMHGQTSEAAFQDWVPLVDIRWACPFAIVQGIVQRPK